MSKDSRDRSSLPTLQAATFVTPADVHADVRAQSSAHGKATTRAPRGEHLPPSRSLRLLLLAEPAMLTVLASPAREVELVFLERRSPLGELAGMVCMRTACQVGQHAQDAPAVR